jgi:cytoskeletal protein CcmA (bactofilin family)
MKKEQSKDTISTFIGPGVSVEGEIEFQGSIRLDGRIKGRIFTDNGTVIIGEKAVISADLFVDAAIIMGEVNGTIDAREKIEVYPPGRIFGDIQAPSISIDSGVVFNGTCMMKPRATSLPNPAKTKEKSSSESPK